MSQNQSKYMKTWTDAYAEVRAKTEEVMGPTGVVLELSHEDWEKMQRGATIEELKSLQKEDDRDDWYAGHDPKPKKPIPAVKHPKYKHGSGIAGQSGNTGDNERVDKIKARLKKAQDDDRK